MRNFFNKKVVIIAVAALLVAIMSAVTLAKASTGTDAISSGINMASAPGKSVMSSLVSSLEKLYGYMYKYDQIVAENDELREKVAQLEEEYREYTEISAENERLRELLNMSERHSEYELVSATLISWSASNWESSFTIGKGTDDGIAIGDPVITELSYVVGKITEVNPSSATVTTILDTSSSVGATIFKTGESAVAQGDFSLMGEGRLRLSYLPEDTKLLADDTIIASGKGGVYPQGLEIGSVADMVTDPSGLGDYAVIEPSANFDSLTNVYVITDFKLEAQP
ncbi:MAG: rod shape-determining protein MreC [Oscillospiraceae bacterium]